jgi:tetratricopeptide (TPR) repeat protein
MRLFAAWSLALSYACASQPALWVEARSSHFEVYSEAGAASARARLAEFERLHEFFDENKLLRLVRGESFRPQPLRIVEFRSIEGYRAFRLRPTADAYYVFAERKAYIVLPELRSQEFNTAAHEYAHFFLQTAGLKLPPWLNEGLAEFFSTVRVTDHGCSLGGVLPRRMEALKRREWIPLGQLLALPEATSAFQSRDEAGMFYAESWALTDFLLQSPAYASHFRDLLAALNSAAPSARVLSEIYGRSLEAIASDMRTWVGKRHSTAQVFPAISATSFPTEVSELSDSQSNRLLADLLLATGNLDRAETRYLEVVQKDPGDPNALAALGTIALRTGNRSAAMKYWQASLDKGVEDAALCYRYAVTGEDAGLAVDDMRRALERAIFLEPDFDDARYRLALLENNTGNFAEAVTQLRAMRRVSTGRAYAYWSALSYASMELGDRGEAENAAQQAMKFAQTVSDRQRAAQLAYVAETDVVVRFAKDADGQSQLVTARVPHGTVDWNPFIEPTDHIQQVEGQLREVRCADGKLTGLLLDTPGGLLALDVPNPSRVLMRNGPMEFTCGPQSPRPIEVQYAAAHGNSSDDGIVRGVTLP